MINKVAITWINKYAQGPFGDTVTIILEKTTGNPSFASLAPLVATTQTAFDTYQTAAAKAASGDREAIVIRNEKRDALGMLLVQLANGISTAANGNMAVLISSGFPVQKQQRTPVGPLPTPDAPLVTQGPVSGTLIASAKAVKGASIYNWSVALETAPNEDVQDAQTTAASAEFDGLTPGKVYVISLNAVGAAGASNWSDYGSLMAI